MANETLSQGGGIESKNYVGGKVLIQPLVMECVGRNFHVLNSTFTLVNETQASSVAGHHTIAILELSIMMNYQQVYMM